MEEHEAIVKNRSAALRAAFPATVPVMTGYLCLGAAFGILLRTAGYGIGWSIAMSMICYCGSMQFVGVSLLTAAFDPFQALLMSVMVNARHAFYGLSMLEKYRGTGPVRPVLICTLTDETFSLVSTLEPPEGLLLLDLTAGLPLLAGGLHTGERCGRAAYLRHHRLGFYADGAVYRAAAGTGEEKGKPGRRDHRHGLHRSKSGGVWPG